jgi:NAD(P)-dependent dehydrogenase (short-subunit alcohol dehydrogenase family)
MANGRADQGRFSVEGKVALVTGSTGVLGGAMARGLAAAGAKVAIMGRRADRAQQVADEIVEAGGEAIPLPADVLDKEQLVAARTALSEEWDGLDILVNAAGGNSAGATILGDLTFFDMSEEAFNSVLQLNLTGTLLPTQVFGPLLVESGSGSIVNISSMAAARPLTRVVAYASAKAAIDNFTKWLAVELIQKHGEGIRVNAIAPGFFIGEQNRDFLLKPDGSLTARGEVIIEHTPMGRFGEPEELIGTLIWLCSDAARFVTGVVVPVDGGFSAFGGV